MTASTGTAMVDVAIIGGGVGGVYTGWRLTQPGAVTGGRLAELAQTRGGPIKVVVYEGSQRVGGRLESLTPPGAPDLRAEFGGMGYTSNHTMVKALIEDVFNLPTRPFVSGTPNSINYLRGIQFRESDYQNNPSIVPYHVLPNEVGKDFADLILQAVQSIIPNVTDLTPAEWQHLKQTYLYGGRHLYEMGFWNLLLWLMSNEAYELCVDGGGHFPFICNWNAAEALEWYMTDYKDGTTVSTISTGYDQLPLTLAEQFQAQGGEVELGHWVRGVRQIAGPDGEAWFRVDFRDREPVVAPIVVLAMPRRSLELLQPSTPLLRRPMVKHLITTVTPQPVMKIFACYGAPWWNQVNITEGRSVTDIPVRVVYYVGTETQPGNTNSLLMTSYNDGTDIEFWEGLTHGPRYQGTPNPHIPNGAPDYWTRQAASQAMIEEAHRQLVMMHGVSGIPMPYSAAYRDWRMDPFGGAWNTWNVGVEGWKVREQMLQPVADVNLFLVGSAYSKWQGWAEGALETAEAMLEQKLGLPRPPWLQG